MRVCKIGSLIDDDDAEIKVGRKPGDRKSYVSSSDDDQGWGRFESLNEDFQRLNVRAMDFFSNFGGAQDDDNSIIPFFMDKLAQTRRYCFIDSGIACAAEYSSVVGQNDFVVGLRNHKRGCDGRDDKRSSLGDQRLLYPKKVDIHNSLCPSPSQRFYSFTRVWAIINVVILSLFQL